MPKTINFNSINRPYLRLIMQDDAQTTIDVTTPTEAMVEELTATAPELEDVLKTMDANSIRAVYDLAARLISCNLMGLPVTVDDLRGKYRMNLDSLIVFFSAYVEFIEELTKAKKLMLPYYPQADSAGGHQYVITSWWKRLVSVYTGLNFVEVGQTDYLQYLIWRHDAYIYELSRTEAGQEYLNNAWRMEQTEPDRAKLRQKIGGMRRMANNKIKGLTVEIGGDTTKLGKALQEIENKSKSLSGELGQVNRLLKVDPENTDLIAQKQQILSEAVANTAKKLETLKAAEKQVQAQFERGEVSADQVRELRREIIATEQKLGGYERAAQETADAIEQLGDGADGISDIGKKASAAARRVGDLSDAAKDAGEGLGTAGVAAGAFVGNLASEAFGKIVDGLKECIEVTQEYQTAMGKLDTAFTTNGYSSEAALKTYKELQGILGETDQAVEAANHLAILTDNEADLQTWTDICTGVFATFGDSLPIEGLTEAANETAKVGQVTGPLADALNWAGVSEDKFNESLAACTDEQERQQLIMDTLNGLYSEASDAYKETNADVIAANKANEEWTASMAAVGAEFTPLIAEVKSMGAELLDKAVPAIQWVKDNLPEVVATIATLTAGITAFKMAQLAAIASEQGMTLAQYAATQAKTAATAAQNGLNAAMKANPIGFVITAISLLVTAFMYLWNNCESFRVFWQNLWEGAKSTFQSVWTWLSNFFTVTIPDIFNTVISFIETNWQGLLLLLVNPFAGAFKLIYDNCEGFRTKVNEVVSAVLNTLRELPAQVLSVGRNLVEGLWNGINDKLLWLKDKIKSFTESVLDSIKHFFGVNSPSKKTAWIGDMLDQGLASGLLDNMQDPVRAMQRVSDGVLSAAGGTYQTQMSAMQTACAPAAGNVGISAVLERMDRLERAITSMQIYMDGNAVVGAVAQRMDAALGDIYRQNERRAVYGV